MYNHRKNNHFLVSLVVIGVVVMTSQVFATDTSDANLIADMLNKYVAAREQNDYLKKTYDPKFPEDPFGAVVEDLQGQQTEIVF
jgi:hypothetical protein